MAFLRHREKIAKLLKEAVVKQPIPNCSQCWRRFLYSKGSSGFPEELFNNAQKVLLAAHGRQIRRLKADYTKGPTEKNDFEIHEKQVSQEDKNTPQEPQTVPMKKRVIAVGVILAVWGGIYLAAQYMKKKKKIEVREEQLSKVDIGARDYELIDHTGQTRTKSDFLGQWLLLYFGFTHCPDICPEELEKMAEIIDIIEADKSIPNLQPIFISVDPERDTPEVVGKYIAEFHSKFIGLTGTAEQVKQAAKTFRVYFSSGPRDEDNDYVVDHTIVMYLMNPKGLFVDYYGSRGTPNEEIVAGIKSNMKNYAKLHGT